MVSRVYTPIVAPYARSQGAVNRGAISSATEEQQKQLSGEQTPALLGGETNDMRRPSSGLQSVQYDRFQKIPLDAVIHDFKNTMTALGADEQTRSEVGAYLNVVRLQAAKEQPEVSFIKHTLRTAANSLDQFISNALGQPSRVVKEWVDALLLQDIEYHAELLPEERQQITHPSADKTDETSSAASQAEVSAPSGKTKAQLKSLIEDAKSEHAQGKLTEADAKLQAALELLADQDRPEWEGKVWQLRGRFQDQADQWEAAITSFEQAASKFEIAKLPHKQASALQAIGSILEDRGQLEKAKGYYQQVVMLDAQHGNPQTRLRSLNDLGSIHLRQGESNQAVSTLEQAAQLMQEVPPPPQVQSDILSNLGAAHRQAKNYTQAIDIYRQSLQAAKEAKDRSRYTNTLQQLASLYVEANQPDQAMKALHRLKSLGQVTT